MPTTTDRDEELVQRVLTLLASEGRAMQSGEVASVLGVKTHQVQNAMHHPQQTGRVCFHPSEGWSLPAPSETRRDDEGQGRLA